jgi:hypothetical protein
VLLYPFHQEEEGVEVVLSNQEGEGVVEHLFHQVEEGEVVEGKAQLVQMEAKYQLLQVDEVGPYHYVQKEDIGNVGKKMQGWQSCLKMVQDQEQHWNMKDLQLRRMDFY